MPDYADLISYQLCEASDISQLTEQRVLPASELISCERSIVFPCLSDGCIPLRLPAFKLMVPRFSLFYSEEVFLNGFRLFEQNGKLFNDTSIVSYENVRINNEFNQKINSESNFECISRPFLHGDRQATIEIESPGGILVLSSDEPYNFGSWIFRFLPKLLLAKRVGWTGSVLAYQQPWMTSLLEFVGGVKNLIHHDPQRQYLIRGAVIPSLPVPEVLFRAEIMSLLPSLHFRQSRDVSLGDKIYVSRRHQAMERPHFRCLENETGLVAALAELGFAEFIPERYSIAEQIAIFDRARIIVGCGGSNMFGCIFARNAELVVDIESCDEWLHAHQNLFSSIKAEFSIVKGNRTGRGRLPHQNWELDILTFIRGLQYLIYGKHGCL